MKKVGVVLVLMWSFTLYANSEAALIKIIREENTTQLKLLLASLNDVSAPSFFNVITIKERDGIKEGFRTLELAVAEGRLKSLALLLEYVSKRPQLAVKILNGNVIGLSLLHIAIKEDQTESAMVLLNFHDASLKERMIASKPGVLPALVYAAQRGLTKVVARILKLAEVKRFMTLVASPDPKNALYYAAFEGHIDIVRALLESPFATLFMSQAKLYLSVKELSEDLKRETWATLVEYEPILAFQSPEGLRNIGQHEAAHIFRNAKLVRDCWEKNLPYNHTLFELMRSHRKDFNETKYFDFLVELDPFKAYAWFYILKGCNRLLRLFSLPELKESE